MRTHGTPEGGPAPTTPPELTPRAARYGARARLRGITAHPRRAECGKVAHGPRGVVDVHGGGGRAGFGGLNSCGSVWSCPVCAAKIRAERAAELARALEAHTDAGGTAWLLTLTMRHRPDADGRTPPLAALWDDLGAAWHAATAGRAWQEGKQLAPPEGKQLTPRQRERWGWLLARGVETLPAANGLVIGTTRFVEATHGVNGWHLHVHVVVWLRPGAAADAERLRCLFLGMFDRWRLALVRRGRMAPIAERGGLDVRPITGPDSLPGYLTKGTDAATVASIAQRAAWEATRGDVKQGRGGNSAPFELLADAVHGGKRSRERARARALWHEWEAASLGRRFVVWSRGDSPEWLAVLAARGVERTDEEIAEDTPGDVVLGRIAPEDWPRICDSGAALDAVMTAAADGDAAAVAAALAVFGVPLHPPDWIPPPRTA